MRDAPLSEFLSPVRDEVRLIDDQTYLTAGILSYGKGLFERPPVRGAATSYKTYFRLRKSQFVYSKLFAWEGALAVVPPEFDGMFVSQEFPTFDINVSTGLPEYLRLLCSWPPFWERVRAGVTGMGGRRKRVHPAHLLQTVVPAPGIDAQRRIVDLMAAIDAEIEASEKAAGQASSALDAAVEGLPAEIGCRLGDRVAMGSGPSWKAAQEVSAPLDGALPVIGITNTRPDGRLDLTDRRYVMGLPHSVTVLSPSSLVMIRTNGNRDRIGNIYRAVPEAVGCAFSSFQIGMHPYEPSDAGFLFWHLRSPRVQSRISEAASGTTGLGNIAVRWLRELPIPWPALAIRTAYVELAEELNSVVEAGADQAKALGSLRAALLSHLLSGRHEIPHSYDALLDRTL